MPRVNTSRLDFQDCNWNRNTAINIHAQPLREFARDLFIAAGVSNEEATIVAESLVAADLCGHPSHGVVRIPDYVRQLEKGDLVAGVDLTVLNETAGMLSADARLGFGQVQMVRLIDRLAPKARKLGIACGTLVNCGHVGRLGEWVEAIAADGLAGLIAVNDNGVLKCVAPPGGVQPTISTNPIGIGVPTGNGPLVLDISTSAVANGKIKVAHLAGKPVPEGWLQDAAGNPTTNPAVRFSKPRGTILPMGGEEQGYKGFGLGLLFDILVGGLSGGFCPPAPPQSPGTNNVVLLIWDPARFAGTGHFLGEADRLIEFVRQSPRKAGVDAIRLPGDRSRAVRAEYESSGIPIDGGTWSALEQLATRLDTKPPTD